MAILYTYYGDDFTGSTDVLEQLAANGVPSVLFLTPPTPAQLAEFPNVQAIGLAGDARSRSPQWMDANLPRIFRSLADFHAPILHYKVCSTFDSSPHHGNIGRAIELGLATTHSPFVPIVVGAPHLRRFVQEGRLFAAAPDGQIHRIDRHPMAHHPVTPMRQPDLRKHLAQQTKLHIGHATSAAQPRDPTAQAILFDTTSSRDLDEIGQLLWHEAQRHPLFSASSSGLTSALIFAWHHESLIPPPPAPIPITPAKPLLVLSGSCSPVTAQQIRHALAAGFHGIPVDPASPHHSLAPALASLAAGRDTILYTALGTPDTPAHGDSLGTALGQLLAQILSRTALTRVLLCGGDTSSHAVQQLGLHALTWRASLQPGAPLCQAHGLPHPLELVLKGGQVGTPDFFQVVRASQAGG